MGFPVVRGRRLRQNENIRRMVRETRLSIDDLIYPLFVVEGKGIKKEVPSMPGVYQMSIDYVVEEVVQLEKMGIPANNPLWDTSTKMRSEVKHIMKMELSSRQSEP